MLIKYLLATPPKMVNDPSAGCGPQVGNHCSSAIGGKVMAETASTSTSGYRGH